MDTLPVRGHLDGLVGNTVVGWAIRGEDATCVITVVDGTATVMARGLASIQRPDLAAQAGGRCNFAFRIKLPDLTGHDLLRVFADGTELPNSPLRIGPGIFDGYFQVVHGLVDGWITERVSGFAAPFVNVLDQHGQVAFATTCEFDPAEQGQDFAPARFRGPISQACFGAGELTLSAFVDGLPFARHSCHLRLQGSLETASVERCSGWLVSPEAQARSFEIEMVVDDTVVASGHCRMPRTDVADIYPAAHRAGFELVAPVLRRSHTEVSSLSLRLRGTDRDLFDGPYVMGDRAALVLAARRVAAAQVASLPEPGERAVLRAALAAFLAGARSAERQVFGRQPAAVPARDGTRLSVVIPVYRGVALTRACIDSVLAARAPGDRVVVVDDCSPEVEMAPMLRRYARVPDLQLLTNQANMGFVRSVNRALSVCDEGDVVLLNADTELFAGGLDELWRVAHAAADIGTVTALSNNATIFTYPHVTLRAESLRDIGWSELAALALQCNAGLALDVPTGHGFCMLIRRDVLLQVGRLDEAFGRGYGEENDFCNRAADLGYRSVAAAGVLVLHHESISFSGEKAGLLATNLKLLEHRFPEYTPVVMEAERQDALRRGRWGLDQARLQRVSAGGQRYVLVIRHSLGGGTARAIADIEATVGYGGAEKLDLTCREDGFMVLAASHPSLQAVFAPDEVDALLAMLSAADPVLVVVHQVLGYPEAFLEALAGLIAGRRSVFYAHDFYVLCPRVTMINAVGQFCRLAPTAVCGRCVAVGGSHELSRLTALAPARHRALFAGLLGRFTQVVAPSLDTASTLRRGLPGLAVQAVPHPSPGTRHPVATRGGSDGEVVLFGALGLHKGSRKLLEMARLAVLEHPDLRFRVIGHSDIDDALLAVGNVTITGPYRPAELPGLVASATGRLALFLSEWPETFSYTLSEAVDWGFFPLVPDIGAPAERVREIGFGEVFPFPIVAADVLRLVRDRLGEAPAVQDPAAPPGQASREPALEATRRVLGLD